MGRKDCKRLILALAALLPAILPVSAQDKGEDADSLVRLMKGSSLELIEKHGRNYRKAIDATFLHNNTYLVCDTALWNVDSKTINCWGNVQLIQEETVLTSDNLDYYIDEDLAKFRGTLVQLRNKEERVLRTRNLDYNTKDSLAIFRDGASMKDKDGQVIESLNGTYDSKTRMFTFERNVNMYTDSVFVRTSSLQYDGARNVALFTSYIDFWNEGNMLSASRGWYDRGRETFFFTDKVHGQSEDQECWSDSLYYYRYPRDILMLGHVQVQDTTRSVAGLGGRIYYCDSLSRVTMCRDAAVVLETREEKKVDTLYAGADTLVYETIMMCDVHPDELKDAQTRLEDIQSDPVNEYRRKAAQAAAEAAAKASQEAAKNDVNAINAAKASPHLSDSPSQTDTLSLKDTLACADTLTSADTLASVDTLACGDSLAVCDSLPEPKDTTKVGFMKAWGQVRIFRKDIQVRCDSMRYCDLDSIARFYLDPVVWNEGTRQYTSDSLFVLVKGGGLDRASLMSNAFIITQEDSLCYDQIKGAEVLAYFDSTSALRRFDALGGSSAMFFLKENDAIATVNKVDSKMLSAVLAGGEVQRVYYFDSPKNDAYPLAQLPASDMRMRGFNWQAEKKPRGPLDITPLRLRSSQRSSYNRHPRAVFRQTDIYFPGYMDGVYKALEEARIRKKTRPRPSPVPSAPLDSLPERPDTLGAVGLAQDSPAAPDSLAACADTLSVPDSLQSSSEPAKVLSEKELKALERQRREEEREEARKLAIARRDARWAELDARDAAKAAAKEQKKLEKQRAATLKALRRQQKQQERDEAKLQRYIKRYEKRKAREEARAAILKTKNKPENNERIQTP